MAYGAGGLGNFGLFADVIYHEYTHAITDYVYRPVGGLLGPLGAAIHEALSDYFACTLTAEPVIGEFLGSPAGFRNLENELIWPEDRDPEDEEHRNGEILGGPLAEIRVFSMEDDLHQSRMDIGILRAKGQLGDFPHDILDAAADIA